jgi:hypothetical protein
MGTHSDESADELKAPQTVTSSVSIVLAADQMDLTKLSDLGGSLAVWPQDQTLRDNVNAGSEMQMLHRNGSDHQLRT